MKLSVKRPPANGPNPSGGGSWVIADGRFLLRRTLLGDQLASNRVRRKRNCWRIAARSLDDANLLAKAGISAETVFPTRRAALVVLEAICSEEEPSGTLGVSNG